jgi:thiosulfate/3-mercaptopyruvate sulfurtransferase
VHADLERDLSSPPMEPERGGRHPLPALERWSRQLGAWGIDPQTPVVVYDDRGGMMAAARAWWMLRAVGHQAVAVLDGGWQAALQAGLPTSTAVPDIEPRAPYPVEQWQLPTMDMEAVDRVRRDDRGRVVDARSPERYRGETEPVDPIAGHIPGAYNVHCARNLDENGRFKSPDALARLYRAELGEGDPERWVVHCGSGVTACHDLLALERAGMSGSSLYVGSWSEWCRTLRPHE